MIVIVLVFWLYLICIAFFIKGFDKVKLLEVSKKNPITSFSVIIPFRNESKNLGKLLNTIERLNYPNELVEILFVDDDSTDNSAGLIDRFFEGKNINYTLLQNVRSSNSPKKDAISTAISCSKSDWIVTTDADCLLPEHWLYLFDNYIQQHDCNLLAAPVTYQVNTTFFQQFQLLDFLSLQGATIGGFGLQKPFMCNGANLAYKKELFYKVNGFSTNDSIASGDDIFLFEQVLEIDKKKVHFIKSKEIIIQTFPVYSLKNLWNQRVRWASKTANYTLPFGKLVGGIVFLGNLVTAALPFLVIANLLALKTALSLFLLKFFFDYLLIEKAANFSVQKIPFLHYATSSICYPFFSIAVVFGSLVSKYQWKGRKFKK